MINAQTLVLAKNNVSFPNATLTRYLQRNWKDLMATVPRPEFFRFNLIRYLQQAHYRLDCRETARMASEAYAEIYQDLADEIDCLADQGMKLSTIKQFHTLITLNEMSRLFVDEDSQERETYMTMLRDCVRGIIVGLEEVSDFKANNQFNELMVSLDRAKVYDKEITKMIVDSIERVNEIEELTLIHLDKFCKFLKSR